jgi:hypothetical protein
MQAVSVVVMMEEKMVVTFMANRNIQKQNQYKGNRQKDTILSRFLASRGA